ncbi:MAG: DUF4932 domain-containing protein [Candidatus Wallbacteria bacterium]|nr:DUF4932 domain-containing protein [Candidatus Wallbacteria bacterium]
MQRRIFLILVFTALTIQCAIGWTGEFRQIVIQTDPRFELLSLVFRLAGNPEYQECMISGFAKDADRFFGPFREHEAVAMARNLYQDHGVGYDAVMRFAASLDSIDSMRIRDDYRSILKDKRWQRDDAVKFRQALESFVRDSSFPEFMKQHASLLALSGQRLKTLLGRNDIIPFLQAFFGDNAGHRFILVPAFLNGPCCYGAQILLPDSIEECFSILGIWQTDDHGRPDFDEDVLDTIIHEFSHSYVNPLVDANSLKFGSGGEKIFKLVREKMAEQAYGEWKTFLYESCVRASEVCYLRKTFGDQAAEKKIDSEERRYFIMTRGISDIMWKAFQKKNSRGSLEAAFPAVISYVSSFAKQADRHLADFSARWEKERKELELKAPKIVRMEPANQGLDVDFRCDRITVEFDRPMKDKAWAVIGEGDDFPEMGTLTYDGTGKILTIPVKLKPNWCYHFQLNSDNYMTFMDRDGNPLMPVEVAFMTSEDGAGRPKIVSVTPAGGADNVDSRLDRITVKFDRPMIDGNWSFCGGADLPKTAGKLSYDGSFTVLTIPVKLEPGRQYSYSLNTLRFLGFCDQNGFYLKPVRLTFRTAK